MTSSTKCILACIDGSALSNAVIEHAIFFAQQSNLPLKFLHTIEHSHISENSHHEGAMTPNMSEHLLEALSDEERNQSKQLIAEGKLLLTKAKTQAEQAGLSNIIVKQRHGQLSDALTDLNSEFDLVVLGAKGESHDGKEQGLGSQLEQAIRALHAPMFIVKNEFSSPSTLLFAYNGSPTAKKALGVLKNASFLNKNLTLHLVAVQKTVALAQPLLEDAIALLADSEFTGIKSKALAGEVSEELINYQQQNSIDITAMGAFSHGQIHGFFFGSFTTKMLLESKTNFLLNR